MSSVSVLFKRIKSLYYMMKDETVSWTKKLLITFGIVYLLLPFDLIPPVLGPIGFIDDATLWAYIIYTLKGELDSYWMTNRGRQKKQYKGKTVIEGASYTVVDEDEGEEVKG